MRRRFPSIGRVGQQLFQRSLACSRSAEGDAVAIMWVSHLGKAVSIWWLCSPEVRNPGHARSGERSHEGISRNGMTTTHNTPPFEKNKSNALNGDGVTASSSRRRILARAG